MQQSREKLKSESTLAGMVLIALQMGLWLTRAVLESEIRRRAEEPSKWAGATHLNKARVIKDFE